MREPLDWLAGYARSILLLVAGSLAMGAVLTVTGLPMIGWTIYGIGYVGLLVALPAVVAVYRTSMDRLTWVAFAVLYVGLLMGVPAVLTVWGSYAQNPSLLDAVLPYALAPLGMLAAVVTWVGLAFFGLAALGPRGLPIGGALLFVVAALVALPAELGLFAPFAWALGIVIASVGLVWVAPEPAVRVQGRRPRSNQVGNAGADPSQPA